MAKTHKQQMRRQIAQAHLHLTTAAEDLIILEQEFRVDHADYADFLAVMVIALIQVEEMIDQFSRLAWGYVPGDYDTWRNPAVRKHEEVENGCEMDGSTA